MSLDVSGTTVSILCAWMGPTLGGAEEEVTLDTGGSGLPHTAPPDTAGSAQDPAGVVSFYFVFFFFLIPRHVVLCSHAVALCDSCDLVTGQGHSMFSEDPGPTLLPLTPGLLLPQLSQRHSE